MRNNLSKMGETNEINTEFLEIQGNLVKFDRRIIQMSNISMLTTTNFPKIPFPIWSIFVGFGGICCLILGILLCNVSSTISRILSCVLLGVLMIEVPIFAIWFWKKKKKRFEHLRKFNFYLNCGITYTIIFHDLDFLNEVITTFTNILADTDKSQNIYFDIKNSDMKIINDNHDNLFTGNSSVNRLE